MIAFIFALAVNLHDVPSPTQTPQPSSASNPCAGPAALLGALNRPTVGYSPCAIAAGKAVLEEGYQVQRGPGTQTTAQYPQGFERIGLGSGWEFDAIGPSFNIIADQGVRASGLDDSGIGFKFQVPMHTALTVGIDGLYTAPNGSRQFTIGASTETLNIDASYPLSRTVGFGTTLAFLSSASARGGIQKRYTAFQPSVVVTKQLGAPLQAYMEYVASCNAGLGIGGRAFIDYGFQRMLGEHVEIDIEQGSTFSRNASKRFKYLGVGLGLLLP